MIDYNINLLISATNVFFHHLFLYFSGDFIYVYNGYVTKPELRMNTVTGLISPLDIKSTSSDMIVVFTSDSSREKKGFKAEISFLQSGNY